MSFTFDHVVIYGRNLDEYVKMFDLDLPSLKNKRILDCCGGPASFACQASEKGIEVISCDPIYKLDVDTLRNKIEKDLNSVIQRHRENPQFLYDAILKDNQRQKAMEIFINDYKKNNSNRYVEGYLPNLPFKDNSFDLVLCGNFLFIYSDIASGGMMNHSKFDFQFHLSAILELLRISREEIRIYPLQSPGANKHAYLDPIMQELLSLGYQVQLAPSLQQDIIGADKVLRILK